MISTLVPTRMMARALLIAPILVLALAMVPAVLVFSVLSDSQGRRVLAFVRQLRAWHADVVDSITAG